MTTATNEDGPTRPKVGAVLVSLSLAVLLASIGTSIINVGLPAVMADFGVSFPAVQWVVLTYLLAVTALVVSVGRLGDAIGHRRLLLAGLVSFTLACGLCAAAPHFWLLITGRCGQGVGAAIMMVSSLALAREGVPAARTGRAMGLLAAMSATGTTLGPTLGGLLIAEAGWRALFLAQLPLGVLALALAFLNLPRPPAAAQTARPTFDVPGTAVLAPSLAAYALAMTVEGGPLSLSGAGLLLLAAAGLFLFLRIEARVAAPLVPPALLRDRALRVGLAASTAVSAIMMATLIVGPFYLARGLGLDATRVGLAMAAGPLATTLAALQAGRMADRFGAARMALVGLAILVVGMALLAALAARRDLAAYVPAIVVGSVGYGLFQTANNTFVMTGAQMDQRGVVSGLLNLSRNFGLVTGASFMGAIFAAGVGEGEIASATPAGIARGFAVTFAVASLVLLATAAACLRLHRTTSERTGSPVPDDG